ncbi:MAG TPA: type VI secretion system baseplate subunit TssK [Myxococcales bacterium]|nr:type VI secretion system baseplate subunit TssK [Myxococcales bacterium]
MSPAQRVLWTEGLFMTPQHLQQQDLYHEAMLEARVAALSPYTWGVATLELDAEGLAAGQLGLLRFSGVLPDGTPVALERGQPESPAARPVEPHFKAQTRVLEVFLGLPKERLLEPGGAVQSEAHRLVRATAVNRQVPDLTAASNVSQVSFGQRNFAILFGDEPREDYDAIKIAELARDKSGAITPVESYVPPCLRIGTTPWVTSVLRALQKTMLAKQRALSSTRRHRDESSVEFTSADVGRFLQLSALNAAIPVLGHLVDTADLPPQTAYLWLSQIAGTLYTFAADGDPSGLPKFQFLNLRATFTDLFARLEELLRPIALEQCITVPLTVRPDGLYEGKLLDDRLNRATQCVISVKSDLAERLVADQFPKRAKMSAREDIQRVVQAAVPGVPLQVTFRPPPEVPIRPGVVYFTVGIQDDRWKQALREGAVALYLPQPFEPAKTELELLAVPPAAK